MADLLLSAAATLLRILVTMGIAFTAAVFPAVIMGRNRTLSRLFAPLVEFLYSIPKVSLFPLVVLFAGLNDRARIITAGLAVFFQTFIGLRDAAANISPEYILSARSLGAAKRHIIRYVYVPALLPSAFSSLRIGLAAAFAVLFFTETSITFGWGMGRLTIEKWSMADYPAMAAAVAVTAFMGFLLFAVLDFAEKKAVKGVSSGKGGSRKSRSV